MIGGALRYPLLIGDLQEPERRFVVRVRFRVAAVFVIDAHVVFGLIQEADEPLDLVSGFLIADRAEDIGRLSVGRDVQPIQAGPWGWLQTC